MSDGITFITLDSVDSTNDYLKSRSDLSHDYTVVRAHSQTRGRGRFDRAWISSPGLDLTFSFVFRPTGGATETATLTVIAGLALHRAVTKRVGPGPRLRWPNDLYHENKKLAGILCELLDDGRVILGIGVNVNSRSFHQAFSARATSMALISGRDHDIVDVMEDIVYTFREMTQGSVAPLSDALVAHWNNASVCVGADVRYSAGGGMKQGRVRSIDRHGLLIVRDRESGEEIRVSDGVLFAGEEIMRE